MGGAAERGKGVESSGDLGECRQGIDLTENRVQIARSIVGQRLEHVDYGPLIGIQ